MSPSSPPSSSTVPGFFYLYVEICSPADSKLSHCLHLPKLLVLAGFSSNHFFLILHLWQQPLCLDSETAFVTSDQVLPKASGECLWPSPPPPLLPSGPGQRRSRGSAEESLSCVSTSEASVQAPADIPATTLSPGTLACSVRSMLFPVPQRSS